jgi:hypothetical protein
MPRAMKGKFFLDTTKVCKFLEVAVHPLVAHDRAKAFLNSLLEDDQHILTIEFEIGSNGIFEGVFVLDLQVKIHLSPSTPLTTFAFVSLATSQ